MDLQAKIAEFVIGRFNYHDLPALAEEALSNGLDSESLKILAGLDEKCSEDDVKFYFNRSVKELGYSVPEIKDAIWLLVKNVAQRIVIGSLDEYDGGRLICEYLKAWPGNEIPDILWKYKCRTSTIEDWLFDMKDTGRDATKMINSEKKEIREISESMLRQH